MAYGLGQGPMFSVPDVGSLGAQTWAGMSGVHPSSPLVGGRGAPSGGVDADFHFSRTSIAGAGDASVGAATGAPMSANWREIFNLQGNPVGWVMIAAIIYLGLAHVTLHGSGSFGKARAGASASA